MSTGPEDELPPLPEQTSDDTDEGWAGSGRDPEDPGPADDDERYLRERPPHWE